MADVVIANDDLVVLGGPSSIKLELDLGASGKRGSQIFTDVGKPTSPNISFETIPEINDLFINLNPTDNEYLYLYQYKLDNAVLGWSKILRLIPNTILANPILKFINGEAHTVFSFSPGVTYFAKGLYFPLAGTLENAEVENLDYRDINLQYSIASDKPIASAAQIKEINNVFDVEIFNGLGYDTQTINLGSRYLYGTLKASEWDGTNLESIFGYRKVDIVATIGGRSEQLIDIDSVTVTDGEMFPGSLTITNHGLTNNDIVAYLSNGNDEIDGLTDQSEYVVTGSTPNTISLANLAFEPVIFTDASFDGIHSILKFGGIL